jgi:hypothetical protein
MSRHAPRVWKEKGGNGANSGHSKQATPQTAIAASQKSGIGHKAAVLLESTNFHKVA